jgi:hypothetical protein
MIQKHSHYFKDVSNLDCIDIYRVLTLWGITDPCIQHAVKKLLVPGKRGAGKDINKDIQEAIDSLLRWQAMRNEERYLKGNPDEPTVPSVPKHEFRVT